MDETEVESVAVAHRYDEFHPAPGSIVHFWPKAQASDVEPLAAIVVNTGFGYAGPHLCVFNADADGFRFERAVCYGAEFGPAPARTWTWPNGERIAVAKAVPEQPPDHDRLDFEQVGP